MNDTPPLRQHAYNYWHFILISVVASELVTALLTTIQHRLYSKATLSHLLLVGAVDSLFVPLLLLPFIIFFLRKETRLLRFNDQLQQEIAEREQAEEALRKAKAELEHFFSIVPALLCVASTDGYFKVVNAEWGRTLGFTCSELLSQPFATFIHPDDVSPTYAEVERQRKGESTFSFTNRYRCKDGSYRSLEWNASPAKDGHLLYAAAKDVSARVQAKEALARLDRHHKFILDSVAEGILGLDTDGCHTFINPAAAAMLGYKAEELLGCQSHPIWHHTRADGSPYPIAECLIHKALRDGQLQRLSNEVFWRKDGSSFPVAWTSTPIFEDGLLTGLVVTFTDISERQQAEEALRASNEKLLRLADSIPGYIAYVNASTMRYEFVNEAFEKSFKIPRQTIIGSQVKEIIGEKNYEFALPYINEVRSGKPVSYENAFDFVSGKRWMQVNYTPVVDASGHVSSIAVLSYDITDRKQAEDKLKESEEKFRDLFNNSEIAMLRTRVDGSETLDANRKFLELVGKTREEVVGKPSVILWEDPKEREEMLRRLAADGTVQDFEFKFLNEQKGTRYCTTSLRLYQDQGILVGSIADITERKEAEEEKERLRAQINRAKRMESIVILAGGIAHDFNNILTAILGYTELAREDAQQDAPVVQNLDQVLTAANRAKDLVRQILAFSRQSKADRILMQIQPMVKETVKLLRSTLPTNISIKDNIQPQCGTVLVDPAQIHQIVMHLSINAFHAMEVSGGILSITLSPRTIDRATANRGPMNDGQLPPGEYVELTMSDTGSGIGPDIIDKIFDPYFTTKEIGKGTGMGLAIIHGIVTGYGGAITVESALGQGTTFRLYFPVALEEPKDAAITS